MSGTLMYLANRRFLLRISTLCVREHVCVCVHMCVVVWGDQVLSPLSNMFVCAHMCAVVWGIILALHLVSVSH